MTVAEAIAAFRERAGERPGAGETDSTRYDLSGPLDLLARFLASRRITRPDEITTGVMREFVARWYVEEATLTFGAEGRDRPSLDAPRPGPVDLPEPDRLIDSLEGLLKWMAARSEISMPGGLIDIIDELRSTMPRAVEVGRALSRHVLERGGAFAFPEFLTSFEEGGQSQYDIDAPGEIGALESYFRITRIEGTLIEAEDVITNAIIWPVLFPEEVALLITPGLIINLELLRSLQGWRVIDCGFTYPPGTQF